MDGGDHGNPGWPMANESKTHRVELLCPSLCPSSFFTCLERRHNAWRGSQSDEWQEGAQVLRDFLRHQTCSGLPAQILCLVRKTPALFVYARETKYLFHKGEQNPNYGSVLSRPLQVLGSTCLQSLSTWPQADIGEKGKERPKGIQ